MNPKMTLYANIKIKDIINFDELTLSSVGYVDKKEAGITGMNNQLNIRPAYQREFVYKDKQRDAVIETIITYGAKALGIIWFAKNTDDTYELMDGQQRIISICQYINGDYAINNKYFHNLTKEQRRAILEQELLVQVFEGSEEDKLAWFKRINIAGEKLTEQELRNAAYTGTWLEDAKRHFSKTQCAAFLLANIYLTGTAIRQDYLETVLDWISEGNIEKYMAEHQHDNTADELWAYFQKVIAWTKKTFKIYRKEMKGVNFGKLYNKFKDTTFDAAEIETKISLLMQDEDVTNVKGIYEYVLDGEEKHLNIRAFNDKQKRKAFEFQHGYCPRCHRLHLQGAGHKFNSPSEMQGDHMISHKHGGTSTDDNIVMLCPDCNNDKSGQDEVYSKEYILEMIKEYEGE